MGIFDIMNQQAMAQNQAQRQNTMGNVFGGAAQAIAPMMGPQTRPTNMAQVLAAAGGGAMQGLGQARQQNLASQQAATQMQLVKEKIAEAERQRNAAQALAKSNPQYANLINAGYGSEVAKAMTSTPKMSNAAKMAQEAGLKPGTPEFKKFIMEQAGKSSGTTVNVGPQGVDYGKPPTDMAWKRNKDGSVMLDEDGMPVAGYVRGSEGWQSKKEAMDKAKGRKTQTERAGGTVIQDLQRALDLAEGDWGNVAAATSPITKLVPLSDAQAMEGFVQSALSNVGLDTLQQMRENSPTGGALGQVPIQQQQRLEQVLGSLDMSQRPDIYRDNLKRVINIYKDIVYGSPEEIQMLAERGDIEKDKAKDLAERYPLSFDELGREIEQPETTDLSAVPDGVSQELWDVMTVEERRAFQ